MLARPLAVRPRILDAHRDRVGDLASARSAAIAPFLGHDQRSVTETELRAVVLADSQPLHEPEGLAEPGDRLANVGIDQDRDDGGRRDRTVRLHAAKLWPPPGRLAIDRRSGPSRAAPARQTLLQRPAHPVQFIEMA